MDNIIYANIARAIAESCPDCTVKQVADTTDVTINILRVVEANLLGRKLPITDYSSLQWALDAMRTAMGLDSKEELREYFNLVRTNNYRFCFNSVLPLNVSNMYPISEAIAINRYIMLSDISEKDDSKRIRWIASAMYEYHHSTDEQSAVNAAELLRDVLYLMGVRIGNALPGAICCEGWSTANSKRVVAMLHTPKALERYRYKDAFFSFEPVKLPTFCKE